MSNKIYVFSGYSGAGKDTCGNWVLSQVNSDSVKFSAPGKQALAYILDVDPGLFEDREARLKIAPHCQGRTYLQVLVDFYHHRDLVIGADLFTHKSRKKMTEALDADRDVVITDMRNHDEMSAVLETSKECSAKVLPFWIHGGTALDSDAISWYLINELSKRAQSELRELYGNKAGGTDTKKEMLGNLGKLLAFT